MLDHLERARAVAQAEYTHRENGAEFCLNPEEL